MNLYCVTRAIKGTFCDDNGAATATLKKCVALKGPCATLSCSKTVNKKSATRFARFLQNELITDVARFTTHVRTGLATIQVARFVFLGGKTRSASIAIQLVFQQCSKKVARF